MLSMFFYHLFSIIGGLPELPTLLFLTWKNKKKRRKEKKSGKKGKIMVKLYKMGRKIKEKRRSGL
jgi:uncharacterized membrane protein